MLKQVLYHTDVSETLSAILCGKFGFEENSCDFPHVKIIWIWSFLFRQFMNTALKFLLYYKYCERS